MPAFLELKIFRMQCSNFSKDAFPYEILFHNIKFHGILSLARTRIVEILVAESGDICHNI